jgi:hypothetical protein
LDGNESIGLPDIVTLEIEVEDGYSTEDYVDEFVADILSDMYGWCVKSFRWEVIA